MPPGTNESHPGRPIPGTGSEKVWTNLDSEACWLEPGTLCRVSARYDMSKAAFIRATLGRFLVPFDGMNICVFPSIGLYLIFLGRLRPAPCSVVDTKTERTMGVFLSPHGVVSGRYIDIEAHLDGEESSAPAPA